PPLPRSLRYAHNIYILTRFHIPPTIPSSQSPFPTLPSSPLLSISALPSIFLPMIPLLIYIHTSSPRYPLSAIPS
ncbi:MAG: hypothetical protein K2M63_00170, partial [Muribaculaceae bacterium]|nr:hypothetical protein [Muribaculaceae bacterium]